jgi:type IV fimbrial biogenesis protein FimT
MPMTRPRRLRVPRVRGFTIIELMVTVTIVAILLSIAAPSLGNLVRDQRVKTATFDVYSALTFARSEAIKRNADVQIVPVSGNTEWASGWSIQVGGGTLKAQDALSGLTISGPNGAVTYQRDGRIAGAANETFVLLSSESAAVTARCVRLDLSGRPNIKVDTNSNSADGCQ